VSFKMLISQLNKVQLLLSAVLQRKSLDGNAMKCNGNSQDALTQDY
jgi:hypothetical protein